MYFSDPFRLLKLRRIKFSAKAELGELRYEGLWGKCGWKTCKETDTCKNCRIYEVNMEMELQEISCKGY